MKKLLLCVLCFAMLFSCLTLTSCKKEVEDIDGLTVAEAYDKAIKSLGDIEDYQVDLSMKVKVFGISFMSLKSFYSYTYNGLSGRFALNEESLEKLEKWDLDDAFDDLEDEIIYIESENKTYVKDGSSKYYYNGNRLVHSDYELAVESIIENEVGDATCYKKGKGYFVQIVIDDKYDMELNMGAEKETYNIYFDKDGYITKIVIEADLEGPADAVIIAEYSYEDVPTVTAPADASNYRQG